MIFRLARLQIQSHRLRTGFVAVAVVLTAVLYMTVISFAYCALDSVQLSKMLASGSDITRSFLIWDILSPVKPCGRKYKAPRGFGNISDVV